MTTVSVGICNRWRLVSVVTHEIAAFGNGDSLRPWQKGRTVKPDTIRTNMGDRRSAALNVTDLEILPRSVTVVKVGRRFKNGKDCKMSHLHTNPETETSFRNRSMMTTKRASTVRHSFGTKKGRWSNANGRFQLDTTVDSRTSDTCFRTNFISPSSKTSLQLK